MRNSGTHIKSVARLVRKWQAQGILRKDVADQLVKTAKQLRHSVAVKDVKQVEKLVNKLCKLILGLE